jgi:hypothetical protein
MAKKTNSDAADAVAAPKRTPQEKAQRKADKASRRASQDLTDSHTEKKASQKETLKTAAKQLQKELDARMSEMVARIRKETKAKLKEVVKEATRRLDVDTERMFEQALHTIVRHYDSVAPGRSSDLSFPAPPAAATTTDAADKAANGKVAKSTSKKEAVATKVDSSKKAIAPTASKPSRPASTARKPAPSAAPAASPSRGPGRPKRTTTDTLVIDGAADLSTPTATTNDGAAVDNV